MDKKFIKMVKKGGEISTIIEQWERKQKELKKKGLEDKEIASISIDRQRNADLEKLTKMMGPFTSPDAEAAYMEREDVKEDEKSKRLYLEVRHAKNSSVLFLKVSEVFRLKKNSQEAAKRNIRPEPDGLNR